MTTVKHATDETFTSTIIDSNKPVLVDFWAAWCGPCVAMNPILEQFASDHADKIEVVKINVDQNPDSASSYRITSIPALKVFKDGVVVKELLGAMPKAGLEKELADFIG